jgi:hypothetical protein
MTTAHRPTWAPARGGEEQGGMRIFAPSKQVSAKNQAAHTKMKFRWAQGLVLLLCSKLVLMQSKRRKQVTRRFKSVCAVDMFAGKRDSLLLTS